MRLLSFVVRAETVAVCITGRYMVANTDMNGRICRNRALLAYPIVFVHGSVVAEGQNPVLRDAALSA